MHTLEELDVYSLSQSFSDRIWFLVLRWDKFTHLAWADKLQIQLIQSRQILLKDTEDFL